jgi:Zn finger protein HypA/HybF involved in hydrogenase expression
MNEIDIISIDNDIKKKITDNENKIHELRDEVKILKNVINNKNINIRVKTNLQKIYDDKVDIIKSIETSSILSMYICETTELLTEYKKLLSIPREVSFMGKQSSSNKTQNETIKKFLKIASKYDNIKILFSPTKTQCVCKNCLNKSNFIIIDSDMYVCNVCFSQQSIMIHNSTYTDVDRVNISSIYKYERSVHFRDCIKQYQGKQNCTIPDKLYQDLEKELENHHLLIGNSDTPRHIRFSKVTKKNILMFLKELGYSNHYENIHLIHYKITDIKPDDIGHLEESLMNDFETLSALYYKKFKDINRKNFINSQYVLYQLLLKHKHQCNEEDFGVLKTIDRKLFHDDICKTLFEELGWNHISCF